VDLVLVRVQSDGQTQRASVDRERTVIGRQTGCHLRIGSGEVSREHCELLVDEGTIVIRDLGSRNGTFVNAVRVNEKRLEAGDLLSVGPIVFLVQIAGEPSSFDASALHAEGLPASEGGGEPKPAAAKPVTEDPPTTAGGGLLDGIADDPESSSVVEFDFDFDDEEEEQRSQPPL
jgi:pSer/pThr/pTyr-binding forkhead associated (FHA) protein